jgi:2-polyprenyl-3-methyl-5-hydroxy-6-metoxy-1,4-benzoquinol methylase
MAVRPPASQAEHQRRLNDAYVSTNFGNIRDPQLSAIRRNFPFARRHLLRHLSENRAIKILDVGCGYGGTLYTLQQHGYRNVIGIDSSQEQVQLAGRLGIEGVRQADAVDYLRTCRERFDAVLALDVVEHFRKPDAVDLVDAVGGALRPGGRFIVHTVNAASPFSGAVRYGDLTHELAFTRTSIAQLLRLGGFEGVDVFEVDPAVHGAASGVRWLLWQGIRSLLAAYLAVETGFVTGHILSQNLVAVGRKR